VVTRGVTGAHRENQVERFVTARTTPSIPECHHTAGHSGGRSNAERKGGAIAGEHERTASGRQWLR
jgi:hypothetical protein